MDTRRVAVPKNDKNPYQILKSDKDFGSRNYSRIDSISWRNRTSSINIQYRAPDSSWGTSCPGATRRTRSPTSISIVRHPQQSINSPVHVASVQSIECGPFCRRPGVLSPFACITRPRYDCRHKPDCGHHSRCPSVIRDCVHAASVPLLNLSPRGEQNLVAKKRANRAQERNGKRRPVLPIDLPV